MDYRDILKSEFSKRVSRNAFYSLRAFSRDVGVVPSRLSESMNGKRGISVELAYKIVKALKLPEFESHLFILSVQSQHSRGVVAKKEAQIKLKELLETPLAKELKLNTIVSWDTEAVYKLSQRCDFVAKASWIAQELGISVTDAFSALRFLRRLGFLDSLDTKKAYLADRAKGKKIQVDYEHIQAQGRKKSLLNTDHSQHFEHQMFLLERSDFLKVQIIFSKLYKELAVLEKKTKNAEVFIVNTQFFSSA